MAHGAHDIELASIALFLLLTNPWLVVESAQQRQHGGHQPTAAALHARLTDTQNTQ